MTNKLEIDIDLAERIERALNQIGVQDHLCDYALVSDVKKELRALLAAEPSNKCGICGASTVEGCNYLGCHFLESGNAAPVVERQPAAWIVTDMNGDSYFAYDKQTPSDKPLYAEQPAPVAVVPDGWKLVPIEPTAEMIEALAADIYPDDNQAGKRLQRLRGTSVVFPKYEIESAVGKYERMINAAPDFLDKVKELNQ